MQMLGMSLIVGKMTKTGFSMQEKVALFKPSFISRSYAAGMRYGFRIYFLDTSVNVIEEFQVSLPKNGIKRFPLKFL